MDLIFASGIAANGVTRCRKMLRFDNQRLYVFPFSSVQPGGFNK